MAGFTAPFGNQIDLTGQTAELWESSVVALAGGRTAISWTRDGNEGVFLRFLDANSNPEGPAIEVTSSGERANRPSIAVLDNGTLIVTYTAFPDGEASAIFSRVFTSQGVPLTAGTQLFTDPSGVAVSPETIGLANGRSVTVFTAFDSDRFGAFAQLADANGAPIGDPLQINQTTKNFQSFGIPARLNDGGFAVTWDSREVDSSFYAAMVRFFNADGTPRTNEIRVNQYSDGSQRSTDVDVLSDGRIIVTWTSQALIGQSQDGSGDGIYARIYSATGIPQGSEFRVNTTTQYDQKLATVAATPDGGFIVTWMNEVNSTGSVTDIRFQQFDASGDKIGDETVLAESPQGIHQGTEISISEDGIAKIVWNFTVLNSLVANVYLKTVKLGVFATADDDVITGTGGADYLGGLGGNDTISGADGADILVGDDFELRYALPEANQVFRLYQATFNRTPDEGGQKRWASDLFTGTATLEEVREGFVGSQEFRSTYDALDNINFVKQMYINVLDRDFDQGEVTQREIDNWANRINDQFTRADVVNGFAQSQQLINNTQQAATELAFANDPASWSDDVYRLYQATLERAPDLAGFENWSDRLAAGRPLAEVISGFTNSQEFTAIYGVLNDPEDFVKLLYRNVLDRDFDLGQVSQAEITGWTSQLDDTFTRADIVQGFSQSAEFIRNTADDLKVWVRAQGEDDQINGGTGTNVLAGGALADTFVFDRTDGGTNTVVDLEAWDYLSFEGFGYSRAADARDHLTQTGNSVVFADQGTEVTFERFQLVNITDDMILV